ncbi:MAG: recombinase family protein [Planctomycetaceae bacterium]|nr:recombinase family protein [Planctomycetaceae bacterium]
MFPSVAPLVPKNPLEPLQVIMLGRISTPHQDIDNIEASYRGAERHLDGIYQGARHIKHLGERGSGWKINRSTILEALQEISTGKWDLVITEDLGRAYRNPEFQYHLAYRCLDNKTRLICFGDGLDTGKDGWEILLNAAVSRHSSMVPETRRRVRRTATYQFHQGGMVVKIRYGYRRLTAEEAASGEHGPIGLRMAKIAECTPFIHEMRNRVLRGENYAPIARWLNDLGVAPGNYATTGQWSGSLVADLLRDSILQGERVFRDEIYELIFATGEHRREPNPNPEIEVIPALAHMTAAEQQELWEAMDRHSPPRGEHPRKGTARKDSLWPGQHLRCSVCGDEVYWTYRGRLRCRHAQLDRGQHQCWNRVQVEAAQIRSQLLPKLLDVIRSRPELLLRLVDVADQEFRLHAAGANRRCQRLADKRQELETDLRSITRLLIKSPESNNLLERHNLVEAELLEVRRQLACEEQQPAQEAQWATRDQIEGDLEAVILHLAATSFAFSRTMRSMFADFVLVPVQAFDTPQIRPRIKLTLAATPNAEAVVVVIDAFQPPQHIRHASDCRRLRDQRPEMTLVQIGAAFGIGKKAVSDALKYADLMEAAGSTDTYR